MAEPFLGEVRAFTFGFTPKGWAPCNGQTLAISTNHALYALLGTNYGGNGTTTFCLPNLNGRVPVHPDSSVHLGQAGGEEAHTLTIAEMPQHTHEVMGSSQDANSPSPDEKTWAKSTEMNLYTQNPNTAMSADSLTSAGGGSPHDNIQPYTVVNYCIAIQGIFPPRN